jgi:hypothetical protein
MVGHPDWDPLPGRPAPSHSYFAHPKCSHDTRAWAPGVSNPVPADNLSDHLDVPGHCPRVPLTWGRADLGLLVGPPSDASFPVVLYGLGSTDNGSSSPRKWLMTWGNV